MARERAIYIGEVLAYVEDQLQGLNSRLPVSLKIDGVWGAQSDWRLSIGLNSTVEDGKWFDVLEVLATLGRQVNEKFKQDEWYHGIELLVPDRLIGLQGLESLKARQQQEADNDNFRRVRLRKNNG